MTTLIQAAATVAAITTLAGAAVWAADTRYVTIAAQQQAELRQLRRDIKRLELKDESGNASPEDRAFLEFLKRDAEELSE